MKWTWSRLFTQLFRAAMTAAVCAFLVAALIVTLKAAIASTPSAIDAVHHLRVAEVQGIRARGGRQLQQTFGASSIVPMVMDDSPCVSFNADDSAPVLNSEGSIVGYSTVHSNGYDSTGLSIMRLDVVAIMSGLYFANASASVSGTTTNIRATLSTDLPEACPSTAPPQDLYTQGVAVDCSKRRATLDVSVPTSLFNCTTATTEDFTQVFFLQIEAELAERTCASVPVPFYAGGVHNSISSGCTYIMVTAACRPSRCVVDTSSLSAEDLISAALGSSGRIPGGLASRNAQRANSAYDTGISATSAAVVGGVVGGLLLVGAVVVGWVLFRRGGGDTAGGGERLRRSHSVASDYLDADRFDSFTIDAGRLQKKAKGGGDGGGGKGQKAKGLKGSSSSSGGGSRMSMSGMLPRPSELRAQATGGRWRDKFGGGSIVAGAEDAAAVAAAAAAAAGGYGDGSVAGGAMYSPPSMYAYNVTPSPFAAAVAPTGYSFTPQHGGRTPSSLFFSGGTPGGGRAPSVFAPPRGTSSAAMMAASSAAMGSIAGDAATPRSQMSMSVPRRSGMRLVGPASTVPMVLGRGGASVAGTPNAAAANGGTDGDVNVEMQPPQDAQSVFLNPLALMRGGDSSAGGADGTEDDRSGNASPRRRMSTMTDAAAMAAAATPRRPPARVTAGQGPLWFDDCAPLIRQILEEEEGPQGQSSHDGSAAAAATPRQRLLMMAPVVPHSPTLAQRGGGNLPPLLSSPMGPPSISRRGGGSRTAAGPVAEGTHPLPLPMSPVPSSCGSPTAAAPPSPRAAAAAATLRAVLPPPPRHLALPPLVSAAAEAASARPATATVRARPSRGVSASPSLSSLNSLRSVESVPRTSRPTSSSGGAVSPSPR